MTSVTYSEFPPTTRSQRSTVISFSVTYVVGNILLPTDTGISLSLSVIFKHRLTRDDAVPGVSTSAFR